MHRSLPTFVDAPESVAEREDEAGLAVDVARRGVARGVTSTPSASNSRTMRGSAVTRPSWS